MRVPVGTEGRWPPTAAAAGTVLLAKEQPSGEQAGSGGVRHSADRGAVVAPLAAGGWVAVVGAPSASPETIGDRLRVGSSVGTELGSATAIVWDPTAARLTLARPPGASVPLNVRLDGEVASWSTRMSDLIRPGDRFDRVAAAAFLQAGYLTTRSTLVEGIVRVVPGETVTLSPDGVHRYPTAVPDWPRETTADGPTRLVAIREAFAASLDEAVRGSRRPSLTLSGGIDSTMIAVGLRRYLGLRPTAFTVRFPGAASPFDEFDEARLTARTLGIEHEPIDLDPEFVAENLAWMVRCLDAPFSYAVHTANLVPVIGHDCLVSGAGGDAWGLTSMERAGVALGRILPRQLAPAALRAGGLVGSVGIRGSQRLRGTIAHAADPATALVTDLGSGPVFDVASSLFGRDTATSARRRLVDYFRSRSADAAQLSRRQVRLHLWAHVVDPEHSIGWTSAWTDVYGIPARFPYLHPELGAVLAEHATGPGDRSEFRALAAEHLPREASHRPKVGQSLPLAEWFRTSLRDLVETTLDRDVVGADGLVDPDATRALVDAHMSGVRDHRWDLLKVMTLLEWKRQVFEPAAAVRR